MQILPALAPGRLTLALIDPDLGHAWLMEPLAVLAARGLLRVVDGGNRFDAYRLARALRRGGHDPSPLLARVAISRAFTCHQLAATLAPPPDPPAPLVVLDLLSTFQDENVPLGERARLFDAGLARLRALARAAPVLVTARSAHAAFLEPLCQAADRVLRREPQPAPRALPLFEET